MDRVHRENQANNHRIQDLFHNHADDCDSDSDYGSEVESRLYAEIYHSNDMASENVINNKSPKKTNIETGRSCAVPPAGQSLFNDCTNNHLGHSVEDHPDRSSNNLQDYSRNNTANDACSSSKFQAKVDVKLMNDFQQYMNRKECEEDQNSPNNNSSSEYATNYTSHMNDTFRKRTIVNSYNQKMPYNLTNRLTFSRRNFNNSSKTFESPKMLNQSLEKCIKEKSHNNNQKRQNDFSNKQKNDGVMITEPNKKYNDISKNGSDNSCDIVELSSECSELSSDEESKYDAVKRTKNKLKSFASNDTNDCSNSNDNSSDSKESILELPVPPKPTPVLIDLKDSDSNSDNGNDKNHKNSRKHNLEPFSNQKNLKAKKMKITHYENSERDEPNSLILNCTEIQKGASNLDEIRKMSQEASTTKVQSSKTTNCSQQNNNGVYSKSPRNIDSKRRRKRKVKSEHNFFVPMSKEMRAFYNEPRGGESFDVEKLKRNMPSDPKKWVILDQDLVGHFSNHNKSVQCHRCYKRGHTKDDCPEPLKFPSCHMCGTKGHRERSCPHKKCLTCGAKQSKYSKTCENCAEMLCSRCNSRGHLENSCPDLWRRYHNTVSVNSDEIPRSSQSELKPSHQLYCCNCAKRGHESSSCKESRWSQHFSVPSYIVSYEGPMYSSEISLETRVTITQGIQDNLRNPNLICDNSTNSLNTRNEQFLAARSEANVDNSSRKRSISSVNEKRKVIFEIKSKLFDSSQVQRSIKINLSTSNKSDLGNAENWRDLKKFLSELTSHIAAYFLLEQKNRKELHFYVKCSRNHVKILKKLITQYADRTTFQRSQMFLEWERDPYKITDRLNSKILEIKELDEDPLELYEKCTQLHLEFVNSANNENSFEVSKRLAILQEKLLLSLYKEGFADDSLKRLKKLRAKVQQIQDLNVYSNRNLKKNNQKHSTSHSLLKFKLLFEYINLYNNVFTPHEPKNLNKFIENYKEFVSKRNNFLNNRNKMFTMQENKIVVPHTSERHREVASSSSQVSPSSTIKNSSATFTMTSSFSNSQMTSDHPVVSSDADCSKNNIIPNGVLPNFRNARRLNGKAHVPAHYIPAYFFPSNENMDHEDKYARKLLTTARSLREPHLQRHIDILDEKFTCLPKIKHVHTIALRKLVQKCLKYRRINVSGFNEDCYKKC